MKTIEEIKAEVQKKSENGFIRVIIVFMSPAINDYKHREAYFTDVTESDIWKNKMLKVYQNLGVEVFFIKEYIAR